MKTENCEDQVASLSRRNFLKGIGVVAAGSVATTSLLPTMAYAEEATAEKDIDNTDDSADVRIFDGVELSMGHVVHNPAICSGCRTCEIVCSVYHDGIASSSLSRIQWKKRVMDACITDILACKQCAGAECVAICPNDALHVDPETGARVIDEKSCIGCQLCLNACPVEPSRIRYNAAKNVCFKCDLCNGDPQCVKFCPTGSLAASWIEVDDTSIENGLYELNLTGEAKTWTHIETSTLSLNEATTGINLDGVLWTSHATHSSIVLGIFEVSADFYDANGGLLGSSDNSVHIEIPEMSSSEFALTWSTSAKITDIGKIVINVNGDNVTNIPGQEE